MTTAVNPATEVMLIGRVVCGHPMVRRQVMRKLPGAQVETPVIAPGGQPVTEAYFALAIPKAGEADWKQSPWGQQIQARALQDWPNGEHGAPTFSWKIKDGDSHVPNTVGKKPAEREGWPGHWIVHCSTQMGVRCHHVGKYAPYEQIQDEAEIKTGDYARVLVGVKGNGPSQSPGVYVNPILFELSRAGEAIISESGPSAMDTFAMVAHNQAVNATTTAAVQPAVPQQQQAAVQQQQAAVQPATDLLQPGQGAASPAAPVEVKYLDANGNAFTEAQLLAANFQPAQIQQMPRA